MAARNNLRYDYDNPDDDGYGDGNGDSHWWWSWWWLWSVLLIYLSLSFFMKAVCSNCRGAHYKSRKARCTMSGKQVSYYTLDSRSLVSRGFFDAPHRYPKTWGGQFPRVFGSNYKNSGLSKFSNHNGNLVPVLTKTHPGLNNDQCLKTPTRTKMRGRPLASVRKQI